jgi:hypothetical protein
MNHALVRNVAIFSGLVLCSTACLAALPFLISRRGAMGPLMFQAQSPFVAILVVLVCMFFAAAIAGIVARMVNSAVGVFVLGAGVFVLASRMAGTLPVILTSSNQSVRSLAMLLASETLAWALIALAAVVVIFAIGGKLRDIEPEEDGVVPNAFHSAQAIRMAMAGVLMLPIAWLIAKSALPGQAMGATFVGGLAAGLAGRLIMPNVQPVLLFVSPIVFGAIGHLLLAFILRDPIDVAYVNDKLPGLANVMPVHYVAGSLMGVSMGIGWARSFLHHHDDHAAAPSDSVVAR